MTADTVTLSADRFDAVLFDMDGVVTDTAEAHAAAWKRTFDTFLEAHARASGERYQFFDPDSDYLHYVDGKPRLDGVRDFLAARRIQIPEGSADDTGDRQTVHGLGRRKNDHFRQWLARHRVRTYASTAGLIRALKELGVAVAVFSSSRNAERVLRNAGVLGLFDVRVDGTDAHEQGLAGKPDPAVLLEAAARLGVAPARAVIVEDSEAGVEAGARGGFGLVIGISRAKGAAFTEEAAALRARGAGPVVSDLSEVVVERDGLRLQSMERLTDARTARAPLRERLAGRPLAVFLDYDGTLTPIVEDRNRAVLDDGMREALRGLGRKMPVAVISGRDLSDVRERIGLDGLFYAGSHGFEIAGPEGTHQTLEKGEAYLPQLDQAEQEMREGLAAVPGHDVERKRFAIAIHYRRVDETRVPEVEAVVDRITGRYSGLRKAYGKRVFQVQPAVDWDKGRALRWVLERLDLPAGAVPLYIGDDVTDEDAFRALRADGVGVLVSDVPRSTLAHFRLQDTDEVRVFLERLTTLGE